MFKVRVPVYGTIGKSILINPDGSGAQIGSDLLLPDGTTPSLSELADALYDASPPVFVSPNSSGSLGFVFETDVIDGDLLARMAANERITGQWQFDSLLMTNAASIDWLNVGGAREEFLDFASLPGGNPIDTYADKDFSFVTYTIDGSPFTLIEMFQSAALVAGDTYLFVAQCGIEGDEGILAEGRKGNSVSITYNNVSIAACAFGDANAATNSGERLAGFTLIPAVDNGTIEIVGVAGYETPNRKVGASMASAWCINMTKIGASNYAESEGTGAYGPSTTSYATGGASLALPDADGSEDYLLFYAMRGECDSRFTQLSVALTGGPWTGDEEIWTMEPEHNYDEDHTPGDERAVTGMMIIKAPAADTTIRMRAKRDTTSPGPAAVIVSSKMLAIKLSAFSEYYTAFTVDQSDPINSGEHRLETINYTSLSPDGTAFLYLGGLHDYYPNSGNWGKAEINHDVNGGGDTVVSGDQLALVDGTDTFRQPNIVYPVSSTPVTVDLSDSVEATLDVIPAPNQAGEEWGSSSLLVLALRTGSSETFIVGDPSYKTLIEGSAVEIDSTLNVTGAVDFDSTLNVDGDATFGADVVVPTASITVGHATAEDVTIGGAVVTPKIAVHTEGATDLGGLFLERHTDIAGFGGHILFGRTRGTEAVEAIVQSGDVVGRLNAIGFDGVDFEQTAEIRFEIDGTPGVGDMPGRIVFLTTPDGATAPVEAMRLSQDGAATFASLTIGLDNFDDDLTHILEVAGELQLDNTDITVSSNGTVITLAFEKDGGGDVRVLFTDGVHTHDCTPAATIALNAGTDTSPQTNYVYILQSDKALTVSTAGWPSTEHSRLAAVFCQSAASAQTDGVYKMHAWSDHTDSAIAHEGFWIRNQPASWKSGTLCTPTVGAATFDIAVASGAILQLHEHNYPAFDTATGSEVMIVNQNGTPFDRVGNMVSQITDASGGSMSGKYYNLVVWGVVSDQSDQSHSQLMVNLPTDSYNSASRAILDADATTVYDIPTDFIGTGFLIARLVVRHQAGGNTYTIESNIDLRGKVPSTSAGGTVGGGVTALGDLSDVDPTGFSDNDLMYWVSGVLIDTAGDLTWDGANLHALAFGGIAEANLLDKFAAESIGGAYTFTGVHTLSATSPGLRLLETDQAADEGAWEVRVNSADLEFRSRDDAFANGHVVFELVRGTGTDVAKVVVRGSDFLIKDDGDTDFVTMSHDGADFNNAYTNTADVNNTGASVYKFDAPLELTGTYLGLDGDRGKLQGSTKLSIADDATATFAAFLASDGLIFVMSNNGDVDWAILAQDSTTLATVAAGSRVSVGGAGVNPDVDGDVNYWMSSSTVLSVKNRAGGQLHFSAFRMNAI